MKKLVKLFVFTLILILFTGVAFAVEEPEVTISFAERIKFFLILVPAAIGDSINPCAFAVMFILLSSILKQQKSKKTVLLSGFLFTLSVFVSYMAIGLGLYTALANTSSIFYLKLVVGILGIIVGLGNLKDYFWYGKFFKFEVPDRWRPNMNRLIKKVVSPMGAFFTGFIVSLFLLPCTSGPYFVVLGYLASESEVINTWGYIYLFIYNLIFIIPMIVIAIIVASGYREVGELKEYKELNVEKLHLITGVIMLILGMYILGDIFGTRRYLGNLLF